MHVCVCVCAFLNVDKRKYHAILSSVHFSSLEAFEGRYRKKTVGHSIEGKKKKARRKG